MTGVAMSPGTMSAYVKRIQEIVDAVLNTGMCQPREVDKAHVLARKMLRWLHYDCHAKRPHLTNSQCGHAVVKALDAMTIKELLALVGVVGAMAYIPSSAHELNLDVIE